MPLLEPFDGWAAVPPHLATKTSLKRQGLKPGGPPVAQVRFRRGREVAKLFDSRTATARRPPSQKQLEAIARANAARSTKEQQRVEAGAAAVWRAREGGEALLRESLAGMVNRAQRHALATLRCWLASPSAVTVDVETTDIEGAVVEVSVASLAGEVLLHERVNPGSGWPMHPEAQRVDGIHLEALASAPTWPEVLPRVERLLHGRVVLAYKASFDAGALLRSSLPVRPPGYELPGEWGCILLAVAPLVARWSGQHGDFRRPSLREACAWAGIRTEGLPPELSAPGDALRAAALVRAAVHRAPRPLLPEEVPEDWLPSHRAAR